MRDIKWYYIYQYIYQYIPINTIYTRDGSYGLLRRPIRYNTLLIRNMRIIRKRIYAILGGTLGLHQPPPTTTNCPPSLQNIIMPPGKDPEWHRVVVMGQKGQIYEMPDARCQMPGFRDFSSDAPRIREHFMGQNPSVGVAACKADPAGILRA